MLEQYVAISPRTREIQRYRISTIKKFVMRANVDMGRFRQRGFVRQFRMLAAWADAIHCVVQNFARFGCNNRRRPPIQPSSGNTTMFQLIGDL